MYVYEFKRVLCRMSGWGAVNGGKFTSIGDYQAVIKERGAEGWRFAGFIPAVQRGTGCVEEMDLVFEREAD